MINFQNIELMRGQRTLFHQSSFTLHDRYKVGLIGANGSGKSSLFAVLLHQLELTSGEITYSEQLRFSHVVQETPALEDSAIDYVLQADKTFYELRAAINQANDANDAHRIAELYAEFAAIDGYRKESEAAKLLAGLGFSEQAQHQPVKSFSGGWRMRLNLARALICPSDILLLDEPTNHLDLEAIIWLEKWLQTYPGLLLIISHDRDFLDRIIDHVLHIEHQEITLYSGDYSTFEKVRAEKLALQQAMFEKQQRKIQHMMKYVDRFRYKASKARQAQSRLKAIERMETVAAVQAETPFEFEFKPGKPAPYPLLTLENAQLGYDELVVLKQVNFQLVPGDRIALLGRNGEGKSTLVKALAGQLKAQSGQLHIDGDVQIGYFAQHQLELLNADENAMQHMQRLAPKDSVSNLRRYLGGFGFSGDEVLKSIKHFSGGEKARLALAMIVWQKPNLLLLDEPTNHLDMEMRMALMLALQSFEGALVLVSHDRHLIRHAVDDLYLINKGSVSKYTGDLDDYRQFLLAADREQKSDNSSAVKTAPTKRKSAKKTNPVKVAALEKKIAKLSHELQGIAEQLNDPDLYLPANEKQRETLYAQQQQLQQELDQTEQAWLESTDS